MAHVKQQGTKGIADEMKVTSDGLANCSSHIVADRKLNQSELLKVNREIEKLKDRFSARQTCENTVTAQTRC
jgi:hypothetical protein